MCKRLVTVYYTSDELAEIKRALIEESNLVKHNVSHTFLLVTLAMMWANDSKLQERVRATMKKIKWVGGFK